VGFHVELDVDDGIRESKVVGKEVKQVLDVEVTANLLANVTRFYSGRAV
jgi:hypothetical protein